MVTTLHQSKPGRRVVICIKDRHSDLTTLVRLKDI